MHSYKNLPPFDGVVAMLASAELGSFSAAADSLGLTHGSVSRRIGQLEYWLGTPIFERLARGVKLTPAGQRFAASGLKAVDMLSGHADQWRPRKGRRTVRLSVVPSFARLWLIPRLKQLQGAELSIELIVEHRPSDLDAREADIAIRYGKPPFDGVVAQLLFEETMAPSASPELTRQLGTHPSAQSLLAHPLIHDSNHAQWQAWLQAGGISYHPRAIDRRFEDYDMVLEAAASGLGIALLRLPLAQSWIEAERLALLEFPAMPNRSAHYVVTKVGEERVEIIRLADALMKLV